MCKGLGGTIEVSPRLLRRETMSIRHWARGGALAAACFLIFLAAGCGGDTESVLLEFLLLDFGRTLLQLVQFAAKLFLLLLHVVLPLPPILLHLLMQFALL